MNFGRYTMVSDYLVVGAPQTISGKWSSYGNDACNSLRLFVEALGTTGLKVGDGTQAIGGVG